MRGRYTPYRQELAETICAKVGQGWNLCRLAREPGMPARSTMTQWLEDHEDFRDMYQAARGQRRMMLRGGAPLAPLAGSGRGYSAAKAEAICAEIAAGASMNQLNLRRGLPSVTAIYGWLQDHDDFRLMHKAACEVRDDRLADEAMAIADDVEGDVQRDRLRIEMRKWRIGVMARRARGRRGVEPEPKREMTYTWEDWLLSLEDEDTDKSWEIADTIRREEVRK